MHTKEQGYSGLLVDTIWHDIPKAKMVQPSYIRLTDLENCNSVWMDPRVPEKNLCSTQPTHSCRCNMPIPGKTTAMVSQAVGRGCCYLPV